jgi:glycosyltransferase involved in cell wall biosynthesis
VYLLFNDGNSDPVKRVDLAGEVARLLGAALAPRFVRLLILRSVEPTDVVVYLGAVDALIVTSDCEGSPNIVKEGIACRTPIVSYDVGDVAERLLDVPFGRIVDRDPSAMVEALREVVDSATPNELDPSVMDAIDERAVARAIIGLYGTGL